MSNVVVRLALSCALLGLTVPAAANAQHRTRALTIPARDVAAVEVAYRNALRTPAARDASSREILRQLRMNRPIAYVNGYWVTPVNLGAVYASPAVRSAMVADLGANRVTSHLADVVRGGIRNQFGLAFTPNQVANAFMADRVRNSVASLGASTFGAGGGAQLSGAEIGLITAIIGLLADVFEAVREWLTPDDPAPLPIDDPDADPDDDSVPNRLDHDDDGDGEPDDTDAYPNDPSVSICDCRGRHGVAIAFTSRSSDRVMRAVLNAFDAAQVATGGTAINLASVGNVAGRSVSLGVVFAGPNR